MTTRPGLLPGGFAAGTSYRTIPRLLLLLLLLFVTFLAVPAHSQSTWILSELVIDQNTTKTTVGNFTNDHIGIESDPVPPGFRLDERTLTEVSRVVNENDGGVTVDRYRNRVWVTNGDRNNLKFVSFAIDTDADTSGREEITDIAGDYPFGSNITSITIMYGFNGRPKYMYCLSFNQYSYINMRGGQWTWAKAGELKTAPNGNYPIRDFAFGVIEMRHGTNWTRQPAMFAVEASGIVYAWDVKDPDAGLLFSSGCGLFDCRGIAVDPSQPIEILWDGQGDRRLSGRLLCFGQHPDGGYVLRDPDSRRDWPIRQTGQTILGIACSAQAVDLTRHLGSGEQQSTGIGVRVLQTGQSAAQPLVRLRSGEDPIIKVAATNAGAYRGYRAFFLAQQNRLNLVQPKSGEGPGIIDRTEAAFKLRGTYDAATESFVVNFRPEDLPPSPLIWNETSYYYGQWVFVPPWNEHGLGISPGGIGFSDMYRIAVSNAQ